MRAPNRASWIFIHLDKFCLFTTYKINILQIPALFAYPLYCFNDFASNIPENKNEF